MKRLITGLKAEAMMKKVEAVRTEVTRSEDPWWGVRETTHTYVTIEGVEYRKVTDRDGWVELQEV